jgi:hypothetical protein
MLDGEFSLLVVLGGRHRRRAVGGKGEKRKQERERCEAESFSRATFERIWLRIDV